MSQWERPEISPHGDEEDDEVGLHGFGGIAIGHAYEVTEEEERELRKERRRADQRRRPVGFAPWPENT